MLPVLIFASARAGVSFTPLNYRLSRDGLHQLIERLPEPLIIADDEYRGVVSDRGSVMTPAEFLAAARAGEPVSEFADSDDVAIVLFTSGTPWRPKAVELSNNNLTSYITTTVDFGAADPDDTARCACRRMPTLRNLAYGGSKVALPLVLKALDLLPEVGFVNAYGLTETSSTIAVLTPEDHRVAQRATDDAVGWRLGSVGRSAGSGNRGADRRRRWHGAGPGSDGRIVRPRPPGFGQVRGDRLGARRRGLVPDGGRRDARRRGVPVHRWTLRRHHHSRWGEHRTVGGGRGVSGACGCPRRRGRRYGRSPSGAKSSSPGWWSSRADSRSPTSWANSPAPDCGARALRTASCSAINCRRLRPARCCVARSSTR